MPTEFEPIVEQIMAEVEVATEAFDKARESLRAAEVQSEMARDRLSTAISYLQRELEAARVIDSPDDPQALWDWWLAHELPATHIYAVDPLGECIRHVLRDGTEPIDLMTIMALLVQGGYPFRSESRLREVNSSLINLKDVKKVNVKDTAGMMGARYALKGEKTIRRQRRGRPAGKS